MIDKDKEKHFKFIVLLSLLEDMGFSCSVSSTKLIEDIPICDKIDFIRWKMSYFEKIYKMLK